jgi:hypothetical protein
MGVLARASRTVPIHDLVHHAVESDRTLLYRYRKGGTGGLVKCFVERIVEDRTAGDLRCPRSGQEFARFRMIGGRPAYRIVQGKVFTRGMRRK